MERGKSKPESKHEAASRDKAKAREWNTPSAPDSLVDQFGNRRILQVLRRSMSAPPAVNMSAPSDACEREAERSADSLGRPNADPVPLAASAATSTAAPAAVANLATAAASGSGSPLDAGSRARFEARLGIDLGAVRVHDDPAGHRAARSVAAKAFSIGDDIVFGEGRYQPETSAGERLLAHELTHVAQTRLGAPVALRRQQEDEREDSPTTAPPPAPVTDEDTNVVAPDEHHPFEYRVDDREPDLFIVPGDASRGDIAFTLLGDDGRAGDFDVVPSPVTGARGDMPEQAVRMRHPEQLVPDAAAMMFAALDRQLDADVQFVVDRLLGSSLNDSESWAVTERTLRWSQRSETMDAAGQSYFDRFLGRLNAVRLRQPHWYTLTITSDTHTALEWLVDETGAYAEQIHKMVALRSRRFTTTYKVKDSSPELSPGDVAGRFYWDSGSGAGTGLQLLVQERIASESTLARAETAVRSSAFTGIRIVVPGKDGRFYGYAIREPLSPAQLPSEGASGHYYWYYPGTIMVRAGEFRADFQEGGPREREQREKILESTFHSAIMDHDESAVLGLDFDVLSAATPEDRVALIILALGPLKRQDASTVSRMKATLFSSGESPQLSLIMRVILSTPNEQFPAFERRLASRGALHDLLAMLDRPAFVMVGRAFTTRALAATPLGVEALNDMLTLQVGEDAQGINHYGYGDTQVVQSSVVPAEQWSPAGAPRIGHEPGGPGDTGGPIERSAIVFHLGASSGDALSYDHETRPVLPTELVRVEILGDHPQTVIVTAFEAAAILGNALFAKGKRSFGKLANINMMAMAGAGLVRAMGPAFVRALAAGSASEGLGIIVAAGASQAGRQAIMGALMVGSMQVVDAYREELSQSKEGRAFLAIYDLGMTMLVARDVYKLMSSGLLEQMAASGRAALLAVGSAARAGLRNISQLLDALALTAEKAREEGLLVEQITPEGLRVTRPMDPARLGQLFMQSRAEVAGNAVRTVLQGAGASTETADRVLSRLQALAGSSEEMRAAWSAVARKASGMTAAEIDRFLSAVDSTLGARRGLPAADLGNFVAAATRAADPVAYLGEVQRLLGRAGVSNDALGMLARKAAARSVDIGWLNSLGLSDADLSFLGADTRTPWDGIRRATQGGTEGARTMMRARLRGAGAELAAEQTMGEIMPGYRLSRRQVRLPSGKIIDFELIATDGTGRTVGLEVKGYRPDKWRDALNAWTADEAGAPLTDKQRQLVSMLRDDIEQITAAQSAYPGRPVRLGVSSGLTGPTRIKLQNFVNAHLPGVDLVTIDEAAIGANSRRFQGAMGLEVPTNE